MASDGPPPPPPPVAPRQPHRLVAHGDERVDDWYWLRDRENPEVVAYLEAENAHTVSAMAHTEALQAQLFAEIRGRVLESDLSVPARKGPYWYYSRTVEGRQYPLWCRTLGADGPEEVMLDLNRRAEGHEFLSLGAMAVSPDHRLLAWAADTEGDESYTVRVTDLSSGEDLPDEIPGTSDSLEWAADSRTLFYTVLDPARRPWQLWRHPVGGEPGGDVLVHHEDDQAFHLSLSKTRSDAYLVLEVQSQVTTEVQVLDASSPGERFGVVLPRRHGVEHGLDHHGDSFYVVTNDGAENFRLVRFPVRDPDRERWSEVVPHRPDVKLDGVDAFAAHLVLYERAGGGSRISVRRLADGETHVVAQPETVGTVTGDRNPEFDTTVLRYRYTSLVTPDSVFEYDMEARTAHLRKQRPVLGGYDPSAYETGRLWATAPDGVQVPISYVRRRDRAGAGPAPALLYGYGAYEASVDPWFSPARLSLLDRGFLFALAHVRGGGEMGRSWYTGGKLTRKVNTFTDFIACAEHLVARGWTGADRLVIRGGSAGGLLIGAVVNMRPDLFRAAVAEVPFVDCLTTMLDATLPLTVTEWEEWGDPSDPEVYRCMKAYAPYDNVVAREYPAMLVTAGLNDPRVGFWEPAKWVARLRATRTDRNPLLLRTEMRAGHMGPSGRYDSWREEAFVIAFVLDSVGMAG